MGAIKEGVWEPGVKDVGSRELRYPPLPPPPQPLGHTIYLLYLYLRDDVLAVENHSRCLIVMFKDVCYSNTYAGHNVSGHTHSVETCCFSPDSKYLCSGSWDTSAVVWNLKVKTHLINK